MSLAGIRDPETVQTAMNAGVRNADPRVFAKARAEGKAVPSLNHQPDYVVDLGAIPCGAKVAGTMVMNLLADWGVD